MASDDDFGAPTGASEGETGGHDAATTEAGETGAPPARARRTRRAGASRTRSKATTDAGDTTPVADETDAPAEQSDGAVADAGADTPEPAPKARRSRSRTRAAKTEPVPVEPDEGSEDQDTQSTEKTDDVDQADTAEGADTQADAGVSAGRAGSEADAGDAQPEASNASAPPPAPPTFGLIFQAPDPAAAVVVRGSGHGATDEPEDADESDDADSDDHSGSDETRGSDDSRSRESGGRRSRRSRRGARGDQDKSTASDDSRDASDSTDSDDSSDDDGEGEGGSRRSRRRGGRGRRRGGSDSSDEQGQDSGSDDSQDSGSDADSGSDDGSDNDGDSGDDSSSSRRRTRRRRRSASSGSSDGNDDPPGTVTRVREPRRDRDKDSDTATGIKGSTRLEAKRQRRRDGREAGRRRTIITEAQFLARRESVERVMAIREIEGRTEIGVLEDGVLVEHYISGADGGSGGSSGATSVGNVYLGRVQNVLPSMEAAFVDIGKGRNAVLYAGEVNWDAAGLEANSSRRIENALSSGQGVLVQVTKDPIGHKGARLTSQVSLPGRFLVYVPDGSMTGISRKLPDTERSRLKALLKKIVPENAGVIVRTAAEGASEEELTADVERLARQWERIQKKSTSGSAPVLLHGEPGLTVRVVRDVFNEDFAQLVVAGENVWETVSDYVASVAPDLMERVTKWTGEKDLFVHHRIDEQLAKAMDRKVWLPSGGSLVIDRTEAMTVIDVNTGKFTGSGGNLEETVTKNNLEAAEEIVNQLRLRDIGGIIVVDFIDMVLESNRDLVVRRLVECLGRDRTKHQVAEVTSLGLVQMTRKRVGSGLIEVFSEPCEHCGGRGIIVHDTPQLTAPPQESDSGRRGRRGKDNRQRDNGRSESRDTSRSESRDNSRSENRDQRESERQEAERKAPSAAAMAAIAAAAKGAEGAEGGHATDGHGEDVLAPGSVELDAIADAIEMAAASAPDSPGAGHEAAAEEAADEPAAPVRRPRRSGRRAASAPSGVELSSVGLMTATSSETEPVVSAPLTQVAGDASVSVSSSASETGEQDESGPDAPVAASTSRRRPRRRAGAPAGPPTGPDEA